LARSYGISASQGRGAGHVVEVDAESLLLGLDVAVPCGLIINELVTNAYKYAFADGRQGMIRVSLHTLDIGGDGTRQIRLIVSDDGPGLPAGIDLKSGASLGLRLVRMLSEDQLGGQVELLRAAETTSGAGTEFRITFEAPAP
jgi:two-component sensor histidine kinase